MKSGVVAAAWLGLGFACAAVPAKAQDDGLAFAAAIAPEQAFEVCFKPDAIAAAQCAMDKCKKAAGGSDECIITSACGRGWSGSMGLTTGEVHWTETVCGAPNEAAVISALTAFCKGQAKYAQECYLASVWNEQGKEKQIEKTLNPKKLK
ncbi:hypothetical protein [Aestuariivirga sp.]|uniref:hypothetical protein n=1 Tax=Aestuariivirga sp. TaxID=2650926 RepID=UPI0039E647C8